jgi:osmotically-inducible protein OsmY
MGALALVAVALLVLGSMACNRTEEGTAEMPAETDMPATEGTTDTGTMGTGTMDTGTMGTTDDMTLQTNVQNAITAQPGLTGVTATVSMGTVTLSGNVASETEKQAAETAAKAVPGVTNVVNNITVGSAPAM